MDNEQTINALGFTKTYKITRKQHSHPAAYVLIHKTTSGLYVGSTEDLYSRMAQHQTALRANQHKNKNLQNAFNVDKYFDVEFIKTDTREQALNIEQQTIDTLKTTGRLLNIALDSRLAGKGVRKSEQTKEIIRQCTIQQFSTPESRTRHGDISRNLWKDPIYRDKQRVGAASQDKDTISAKIADTVKNLWDDPTYRDRQMNSRLKSRRAIFLDGAVYDSITAAALATGTPTSTIQSRLTRGSSRCHYVESSE